MVWTQEEEHDYLSVPWEDEFLKRYRKVTRFGMKTSKAKFIPARLL